jgi:hypothetical protein
VEESTDPGFDPAPIAMTPTRDTHVSGALSGSTTGYGITYHGGVVMDGTVNIYLIWYGNWSGNTATTILPNFVTALSGSPYEHINTTYSDNAGHNVSGLLNHAGDGTDNYSQGTSFGDSGVQAIVSKFIGTSTPDANGIYFVLTSADVKETSGFCSKYCGWHTHATINNVDVKYAFVGNPDQCPASCEQQTTSPNGNAGADGMASIIAHESEEAISDPNANAWYDKRGNENADKCAWTFGTTSTAANGSLYNVTLGGAQYLIQQNWANAPGATTGYCTMSY